MIETHCFKNVVIFIQTILSFVLSRKIINFSVTFHKMWEFVILPESRVFLLPSY